MDGHHSVILFANVDAKGQITYNALDQNGAQLGDKKTNGFYSATQLDMWLFWYVMQGNPDGNGTPGSGYNTTTITPLRNIDRELNESEGAYETESIFADRKRTTSSFQSKLRQIVTQN